MHRIAVISDVHGNVTALKAVIADARQAHCTDFWYLGDLFVPGPGAHDLLTLLDELPITAYLRGNWEDGLLETLAGKIDPHDPSDVYESWIDDYVHDHLTAADVTRIRHLPMVQILTLDGLTFQLTHNLPDRNSGQTLSPEGDQTGFDQLARGGADVMVYGHVHHQLMRQSTAGQLIVNPGTVGMPFPHWGRFAQDLRAQYAIITTQGRRMPNVTFRQVAYDAATEIALARSRQLPYADLYTDQLTTGHVYTHDLPALTRVTQRPGEAARLRQLLAKYPN